jgi:hypothetical protein
MIYENREQAELEVLQTAKRKPELKFEIVEIKHNGRRCYQPQRVEETELEWTARNARKRRN